MVKCFNSECVNYRQELEENLEVCPACGKATEKIQTALDGRRRLAPVVSIASIVAILATFFLFNFVDFYVGFFIGAVTIIACIVIAFMSRMKGAIITTLLAAAGFIGIFAYYGVFSF